MATREVNRVEQPLNTGTESVPVSMDAPMAAPSQSLVVQRRAKYDSAWETHKPTIRRLYIDEGRSLKEVMEIMKTRYGFEAS